MAHLKTDHEPRNLDDLMRLGTLLLAMALLPVPSSLLTARPATASAEELNQIAAAAARYESGSTSETLRQLDDWVARAAANPSLASQVETALLRLLQPQATPEARLFACQRLAVIGTADSLPALANLLGREDSTSMACLALASHPSPRVDRVLADALRRLQGTPLLQVIQTLGDRRAGTALSQLTSLSRSSDLPTAEAAIVALGKIGNSGARKALAGIRRTAAPALAPAVDEALLLLAEGQAGSGNRKFALETYRELLAPSHAHHVRAGALASLLRLDVTNAESILYQVLREQNPAWQPSGPLRPVAIASVPSVLRTADAARSFAGLLDTMSGHEQALLIEAFAELGPHAPRTAIAARLQSADAGLRLAAIRAFARLNHPSDIPVLIGALSRAQTPPERQHAEYALVSLPGGNQTDAALLKGLEQAPASAKPGLISALARRGVHAAIPPFLAETRNPEPATAKAAFQALSRLAGPAELPTLLDRLVEPKSTDVRNTAEAATAQVIIRIDDATARSRTVCEKLSATADVEGRCVLIRLLPVAAGGPALEAIRMALKDSHETIRSQAVRALSDWPAIEAWNGLRTIYQETASEAERSLAWRGMIRLANEENARPTADLAKRYLQMFEIAKTDADRKAVLGALGGCSHPDALSLAVTQLDRPALRAEAEQAVKRIAEAIRGPHPQAAQAALEKLSSAQPK